MTWSRRWRELLGAPPAQRQAQRDEWLAVSSGPVDLAGIRRVIEDVLASRPPGAVAVSERNVPASENPADRDEVEMKLRPRFPGACAVVIVAFEPGCIWIFAGHDECAEELTAPMNVNAVPKRPALDIIRERLLEFASGDVYDERFNSWD